MAFSPDSLYFAGIDSGAHGYGTVTVWETDTGKEVRSFPECGCCSVEFTPDGKNLVVILPRGVRVFELATGKVVTILPNAKAQVWGCRVSSDGRFAFTWDADNVARLWNLETSKELHTWAGSVRPYTFASSGERLVLFDTTDQDRPFRYWNIAQAAEEPGNGMACRGMFETSFLKGGKDIVVCRDGALYVHDRATGKALRRIDLGKGFEKDRGREGTVSPDGRLFFCSSLAAEPRLWDLATGKQLALNPTVEVHQRTTGFAISPDNRWGCVGLGKNVLLVRFPEVPVKP